MPNTIGNFSAIQLGDNVYNVSIDKSLKSPKPLLSGNLNDYWGADNYGVYYGKDGATNNVSYPPNDLNGAFSLIVTGLDDSRTMQIFIAGYSTKGGVGTITRVFLREHINYGGSSTEWTPWKELINSDGGTLNGSLYFSSPGNSNTSIIKQDTDPNSALQIGAYSALRNVREFTITQPGKDNTWTHVQFKTSSFPYGGDIGVASENWVNDGFLSKTSVSVSGTTLKIS